MRTALHLFLASCACIGMDAVKPQIWIDVDNTKIGPNLENLKFGFSAQKDLTDNIRAGLVYQFHKLRSLPQLLWLGGSTTTSDDIDLSGVTSYDMEGRFFKVEGAASKGSIRGAVDVKLSAKDTVPLTESGLTSRIHLPVSNFKLMFQKTYTFARSPKDVDGSTAMSNIRLRPSYTYNGEKNFQDAELAMDYDIDSTTSTTLTYACKARDLLATLRYKVNPRIILSPKVSLGTGKVDYEVHTLLDDIPGGSAFKGELVSRYTPGRELSFTWTDPGQWGRWTSKLHFDLANNGLGNSFNIKRVWNVESLPFGIGGKTNRAAKRILRRGGEVYELPEDEVEDPKSSKLWTGMPKPFARGTKNLPNWAVPYRHQPDYLRKGYQIFDRLTEEQIAAYRQAGHRVIKLQSVRSEVEMSSFAGAAGAGAAGAGAAAAGAGAAAVAVANLPLPMYAMGDGSDSDSRGVSLRDMESQGVGVSDEDGGTAAGEEVPGGVSKPGRGILGGFGGGGFGGGEDGAGKGGKAIYILASLGLLYCVVA